MTEQVDVEMRGAIRNELVSSIKRLAPQWKQLAQRGASSVSPTYEAFWRDTPVLRTVLELGFHVLEAKKKMHYPWAVDLVMTDADVDDGDVVNHRPLARAQAHARLLLEFGVSPTDFSGYKALYRGEPPLIKVLRVQKTQALAILLESGLDLSVFGGAAHLINHVPPLRDNVGLMEMLLHHEAQAQAEAISQALQPTSCAPPSPGPRRRM